MRIHQLSDVDFILRTLVQCEDGSVKEMGFPNCGWTAKFATSNPSTAKNVFTAQYAVASEVEAETGEVIQQDAAYSNCYEDNGRIHIVANAPKWEKGTLYCEYSVDLPDEMYVDGYRTVVCTAKTDVEIVNMAGEDAQSMVVDIVLPPVFALMSDTVLSEVADANIDPLREALTAMTNMYNAGFDAVRLALESKGVETSQTDSLVTLAEKIKQL